LISLKKAVTKYLIYTTQQRQAIYLANCAALQKNQTSVLFVGMPLKVRQAKPGEEVGHVKEDLAENF